ncbi:MAG TPA: Asp23/Gls24 family envelope stress response protein [Thermoleophilaceae bacterium]|nr:Asp23/Gls24 family envelope stress response protein [Thermoleophilaceae bacterium]
MAADQQTDTTERSEGGAQGSQGAGGSQQLARQGQAQTGDLDSGRGVTTIADNVVAKVVGIAAREVPGVYEMGPARGGRAIGRVTAQVGLTDERMQGVSVEVGQREAAADLTLVIDYGESIARVANEVRDNVIRRVEGLCGLEVTEVNIEVVDLYFPGDEQQDEEEQSAERSRVE